MRKEGFTVRKLVVLLMCVLGLTAPCFAAGPPNIVLIISDDQAWTDYGFMGYEHIRTPNLDRLASQSLTFTRGYVPDSLCRPSLASIVSGLYPHQHKLVGNDPPPPPGLAELSMRELRGTPEYLEVRREFIEHIDAVKTLPEMLAREGYLSFQTGKWWEGGFNRGGFTHGMTHGIRTRGGRHGDEGLTIGREGLGPIFEFIDMAQRREKPFFLWYAPFLPHRPHNPPERLLERYREGTDSIHIARYRAMCAWFDETCGQLLDHLDERGLAENTIVLYVADNGWIQRRDRSGYAARSKRSPNEGGIRTPIMVRWPGRVEPRMDRETLVSSVDLAPTILRAVGLEPAGGMRGLNLLDGDALAEREMIFGGIFSHDVADLDEPVESLNYRWGIEGDWKLILPHEANVPDGEPELYNLREDPHETTNLAGEQPKRVAELTERINAWWPAER